MIKNKRNLIYALIDQALYSIASLAVQIFLARNVVPSEFGAYTVASVFLFFAAIVHQTCIVEPMFVFGSRRFLSRTNIYQQKLRGSWSIVFGLGCTFVGLILSLFALVFSSKNLALSFFAYAFAVPLILYYWILRRIALQVGDLRIAVVGGTIYATVLFLGIIVLQFYSIVSVFSVIFLTGVAAGISAYVMLKTIKWPQLENKKPPKSMFKRHFLYGRWSLSSELVNWAIANGPILILPLWMGLGASASFRVIALTYMPLQQVISVIMTLLLKKFSTKNNHKLNSKLIIKIFLLIIISSSIYGAVLVFLGPTVIEKLFGSEYVFERQMLLASSAGFTFLISIQVFFVAMRSIEKSAFIMKVHTQVLLTFLAISAALINHGVLGILIAQSVAWGFAIVWTFFVVLKSFPVVENYNQS